MRGEKGERGEGRGKRGEKRVRQTVREVRRRQSYLAGWTHSAALTHKETQWKT